MSEKDKPVSEDLITACEHCENLICVSDPEANQVFPCPICGCLNTLQEWPKRLAWGKVLMQSPSMEAHMDDDDPDHVSIPELPEEVRRALMTLLSNGWKLNFKIND